MTAFLIRHLLESTFFCLLLTGLACCLRKGAPSRYAVLLLGVGKFVIPTVWLSKTGEEIASFWPASNWIAVLTYKVSVVLALIQGQFPVGKARETATVWALGTLLSSVVWVICLRRRSYPLMPPTAIEEAALLRACRKLPAPGIVRLRVSESTLEPALHGIWRPTITIPQGLSTSLTAEQLEGVLLHELAHVRRFDNLAAVLVHVVVCLFWFHPLLWLVERKLAAEREWACDAAVLDCGMERQAYAKSILRVCQFHILDVAPPGMSAMTGSDLDRRLKLILEGSRPSRLLYVPWLLVAALTVFMTLVPVAGGYCAQCAQSAIECKTPATCPQR